MTIAEVEYICATKGTRSVPQIGELLGKPGLRTALGGTEAWDAPEAHDPDVFMNVLADLKQFLQRARVFPESYKLKGCGNIIMPHARFGFLSDQPILVFLSGTTLAAAGSPLEACSVVLHLEADQPTVGERRWLRNGKKIRKGRLPQQPRGLRLGPVREVR